MADNNLFKPYEGDEDYIFVSYKHEDWKKVSSIISDLNDRGYRIWYDEGLHGGQNFVDEIAQRIIKCRVFFSFLSKNYITSDYCVNELHYAFSQSKTVVPILLDNTKLPPEIDFRTVKINRLSLPKAGAKEKLVERLCDWDKEILDPCHDGSIHVPPIKPQKPKWLFLLIAAVVIALTVWGLFKAGIFGSGQKPSVPTEPAPTLSVSLTDEPTDQPVLPTPEPTAATVIVPTEKPASSAPVMTREELDAAAKKALSFLTGRLDESVPLSVYDPKGSDAEESGFIYDNAMAALTILTNTGGSANLRSKNVKRILDTLSSQISQEGFSISETKSKDLAALAIALLKADKDEKSTAYVMTAQRILDQIIRERNSEAGGFYSDGVSESRSAADNLWLYSAFLMAGERTKNNSYQEAARSAETFIQSLRSEDGTYYLSGDTDTGIVSGEVQALAAVIMNDRTGIQRAAGNSVSSGGFSPDDKVHETGMEVSALMALAYKSLGMEDEAIPALSAVGQIQLNNGSIPEAENAITDGMGRHYSALPKTSVTAWFALAAAGINPFIY